MSFYGGGFQEVWGGGLPATPSINDTGMTGWWNTISRLMGMSFLATMFSQQGYVTESLRLLLLGSLVEAGRRLFQWLTERMRFQYSITAQFSEGDPAYDWIVLFLTQEKVWRHSRDFAVTAKSSKRKWGIKTGEEEFDENADYVPTYELPQLFTWGGFWIEIKRNKGSYSGPSMGQGPSASIYMTIYTWNMKAFSLLLAEARRRYIETSRPHVNIHTLEMPGFAPGMTWTSVKRKPRRPLNSIVLEDGVIESILRDARDFIDTEDWYIEAGIPHRRGYLLYGPPGTGKSSTIYALAGELGFEIYSLSLSSGFIDDYSLQRAASSIPKHSIFLIEDIDCAFPSREEESDDELGLGAGFPPAPVPPRRSAVTLSGLLNVLDGVDSEEGKIFFATTNYVDRLDAALIRPGRIDQKVEYHLATRYQAHALFMRFFADAHSEQTEKTPEPREHIEQFADKFADGIPSEEFSTADLQGYLLLCKRKPEEAAAGVDEWVQKQREERRARAERERKRKLKYEEAKRKGDAMRYGYYPGAMPGNPYGGMRTPIVDTTPPLPTMDSSGQLQIPPPPGAGPSATSGTTAATLTPGPAGGLGVALPIANGIPVELSVSSSPAGDVSLEVPGSPELSVDGSVVVVPSSAAALIPVDVPVSQPPHEVVVTTVSDLPTADSGEGGSEPGQVSS